MNKKNFELYIGLALICIILFIGLSGCTTTQPKSDSKPTISNIPNIIKGLEALGSVGKKEVDKDEKK